MRVAEVDGHRGGGDELAGERHLAALVPGQRPFELLREGGRGRGQGVADGLGVAVGGQADEQEVAAGALD